MGIFKRLKTMTKAQLNRVLDGMEDPITMLNEYSRELEEAQKALSLQILVEKKQANLLQKRTIIAYLNASTVLTNHAPGKWEATD